MIFAAERRMSKDFQDQLTQSRSYERCEVVADMLRGRVGCGDSDPLPHICEVLDKLGFEVVAKPHEQMGDALGYALPEVREIHLREDVIQELIDNGSDARFTALHEIAHGCTHSGESKYFRMGSGNVLVPFGADDEKAENLRLDRSRRTDAAANGREVSDSSGAFAGRRRTHRASTRANEADRDSKRQEKDIK